MLLECIFAKQSCMHLATNNWEYTCGPHCKGFRNADLQRFEMGQSSELTPLVSLLFCTFRNSLQFLRKIFCGLVCFLFSVTCKWKPHIAFPSQSINVIDEFMKYLQYMKPYPHMKRHLCILYATKWQHWGMFTRENKLCVPSNAVRIGL